jgi:hypothetical protein
MSITITAPAYRDNLTPAECAEWERIGSPFTVDFGTGTVETIWSHADAEDFEYWEARTVLHTPEYWNVLESAERMLTERIIISITTHGETRFGRKVRKPWVAALKAIRAERAACR